MVDAGDILHIIRDISKFKTFIHTTAEMWIEEWMRFGGGRNSSSRKSRLNSRKKGVSIGRGEGAEEVKWSEVKKERTKESAKGYAIMRWVGGLEGRWHGFKLGEKSEDKTRLDQRPKLMKTKKQEKTKQQQQEDWISEKKVKWSWVSCAVDLQVVHNLCASRQ